MKPSVLNFKKDVMPKIAVIGAGYWGRNLIRNFNDLGVLAAVCDVDAEILGTFAEKGFSCKLTTKIEEVLRDPTIRGVAIATPAVTHASLVEQALAAGKDVFVEKPLAMSTAEGQKIIALKTQQILMVGHLLWYHPAVLKLKDLVDEGALGRIHYIYSNRLNLGKIRREENILWSFAPHDISVILGLLNEMPTQVRAQGGNYLHEQISDVTVSLLSFASGVKAHLFVSWLHPFKEQKLVVVGDKQMAVFDDMEAKNKLRLYPHSIDWKNKIPIANRAEAKVVALRDIEPLLEECRHFLHCIVTRSEPRTNALEGLRVLEVLQRCETSLKEGPSKGTRANTDDSQIHPTACIDEGVEIGEGTKIWHYAHLLKGTKIGRRCSLGQNVVVGPNVQVGNGVKIQNNVSVYEGVTLEDHVFCGPSMVFTNVMNPRSEISRRDEFRPTLVKRGATLGANCTIVCGTTLGEYAFVGAGAVVTRDVPAYALVKGSPARIAGWMCACGIKLSSEDATNFTCECGKSYKKSRDADLMQECSMNHSTASF